jgi:hypothetical protein
MGTHIRYRTTYASEYEGHANGRTGVGRGQGGAATTPEVR